jgi:hypothetical protein
MEQSISRTIPSSVELLEYSAWLSAMPAVKLDPLGRAESADHYDDARYLLSRAAHCLVNQHRHSAVGEMNHLGKKGSIRPCALFRV